MALLSLSCNADSTPKKIKALRYHQTSANMWPDLWYDLQLEKDGSYTLTNSTQRSRNEALRVVVPDEVADSLAKIVSEEKMHKYKNHYEPPFTVYDGWQWSLFVYFEDKSSISSGGHMECPSGDGLKRLEEYFKEVWSQVDESQAEIVDIW